MAKISVTGYDVTATPARDKTLAEVLEIEDHGASPRGSSYYKALMACPREFALSYEYGLRPIRPHEALIIGLLWHYCLQLYYTAIAEHQKATPYHLSDPEWLWGGATVGAQRMYAALDKLDEAQAGYGEMAKLVRKMVDAYLEMFHKQDRWRIVAVEETIIFSGAFPYSCRLDLVIHDLVRDSLFIVEHKSAKWLSKDLLDNYQLDLQILGQVWSLLRVIDLRKYPPFKGVLVNLATKPDGNALPKVTRLEVCPSRDHLAAFEQNVGKYQPIRRAMEHLGWPQYFGHCSGATRGYSSCQFYDLCHAFPTRSAQDWVSGEPPEGFYIKPPAQIGENAA